jgi:hypothetical protein
MGFMSDLTAFPPAAAPVVLLLVGMKWFGLRGFHGFT